MLKHRTRDILYLYNSRCSITTSVPYTTSLISFVSSLKSTSSTTMSDLVSLGVLDYVLFAIMLLISAGIGIYSACSGDRQRTTDEYLLGNRQMHIVPVALSMMVSYISAMSVLGLPAEIYMFNTMFMWNTLGYGIGALIATQMFVPIFFELELTSIYEYLELRFNKTIRVLNMLIFFFQTLFYMGMVIYTPALALNAATGMSLTASIFSTGAVCIFYTTIGGIKAVLWTDTFQTFVMVAGVIAIIIAGTLEVGGFDEVWAKAIEGGRIVFFDLRPDLTIRNTFWTVNIGTIMITYHCFGMNQAIVQRCISLGSVQKAKWAIALATLAEWTVLILMGISGVVMYAYYFDCDPYTEGKVFSPDQIMPYMVMEVFAKMPGVPGVFLSSVLSASLSTLSSGLNALAAVAGEDIFKVIWPRLEGKTYTTITKALSFFFGVIAVGVAFLAMEMGDQVLALGMSIAGMTQGAVVATFTLGVCCPRINYKGILLGTLVSTSILIWLKVGNMYATNIRSDRLPLSVEGCVAVQNSTNFTYYTTMATDTGTWTSFSESSLNETGTEERTGLENFYSLSYHLYGFFGLLMTVIVAFLTSAITGFNDPDTIDKRLLINVGDAFFCYLPRRWRKKLHVADDVTKEEYRGAKSLDYGTTYAKIPLDSVPNHAESEDSLPHLQYSEHPKKPITGESETADV